MKFYIEEFYEALSKNYNDAIIHKKVGEIKLDIPSFNFQLSKILKSFIYIRGRVKWKTLKVR